MQRKHAAGGIVCVTNSWS